MASFWTEIEKEQFDIAASGQIVIRSEEGHTLVELLQNKCGNEIKNIVEIGTWNGLGSTLCILYGIENRQNVRFWSLECNKDKHESAKDSLQGYLDERTELLWGSILDVSGATSEKYLSQFPSLKASEHLRHWFAVDIENCKVAPNVLHILPEKIDFLLLDGGEFTTLYEFEVLFERCSGYIALDDTKLDKCLEVRNRLLKDPEWCEIVTIENRNGFSIFKKIPHD